MAEQARTNLCAVLAVKILQGQDAASLRGILMATASEPDRVVFAQGLLPQLRDLVKDQAHDFTDEFLKDLVMRIRNGAELRLR